MVSGPLAEDGLIVGVGLGPATNIHLRSLESTLKPVLCGDAFNSVRGVKVLDKDYLVASSTTLSRDDGGVREEILPDLVAVT